MTLSRGPYNDHVVDKMSLFQDLKLKRRKVDSRCSSDGESLADTSTSSPDLLTPLSPKMCDQPSQNQHHQTQSQTSALLSSAPPTTPSPNDHHHMSGKPMIQVRRNLSVSPEHSEENPSTTTIDDDESHNNKSDIKPNYSHGNSSVIRSIHAENDERTRPRSHSPAPSSPQSRVNRTPPIHNILHHHLHQPLTATTSAPTPLTSSNTLSSITNQLFQQQQQQQSQNSHVTVLVTPPRIKSENQHHSLISGNGSSPIKRLQTNFSPPSSLPNSSREQLENVVNAISVVTGQFQTQPSPHSLQQNSPIQIQMFSQPTVTTTLKRSSSGQISPPNSSNLNNINNNNSSSNNFSNTTSSSNNINNNFQPNTTSSQQHFNALTQGVHIPITFSQQFHEAQEQIRIKRERSPSGSGSSNISNLNQSLTVIPSSPHSRFQQLSPQQIMSSMMSQGSPMQIRQQQSNQQPTQQQMRDAAIMFRVKNEPQPIPQMPVGLMQQQHRMIWGSQTRINGVKPEVIGGPLPPLRSQPSPQTSPKNVSPNQTPPSRSTPTVIMGESCGVRTMVWGFEPVPVTSPPQQVQTPTPPNQTPPSTSHNTNSNSSSSNHSSSNNEEAAHLLLSLGQGQATRQLVEVNFSSLR